MASHTALGKTLVAMLRLVSWTPDYLITTQYPGSSRQAARSAAGSTTPAHFRCSCAFSSDLLAHPGLARLRRQGQATMGLPLIRCQAG